MFTFAARPLALLLPARALRCCVLLLVLPAAATTSSGCDPDGPTRGGSRRDDAPALVDTGDDGAIEPRSSDDPLPYCSELSANCQYRITRVKDKVSGTSFFDVCDPGIVHRSVYVDTYRCDGSPFFLPWNPACPGSSQFTCGCMDGTPPDDLFTDAGELVASNCHEPQCDCIPDPEPPPPTAYGPVTSPYDDGCEAPPHASVQAIVDAIELVPDTSCDVLDATTTCTHTFAVTDPNDPYSTPEVDDILALCQPSDTWQAGHRLASDGATATLTCRFAYCGYQLPNTWTPAS